MPIILQAWFHFHIHLYSVCYCNAIHVHSVESFFVFGFLTYAIFTKCLMLKVSQTKPFSILAVLRRSLQRVYGAHFRIIATITCVDIEAVANRLQRCVRFGRSGI